jgi:hypothetical protein
LKSEIKEREDSGVSRVTRQTDPWLLRVFEECWANIVYPVLAFFSAAASEPMVVCRFPGQRRG